MLPSFVLVSPTRPHSTTALSEAIRRVGRAQATQRIQRPSQRARAPPGLERGSINTASVGTGNATHVSGELFEMAIGVDTVHVPYRDLPYSNPITLPLVEKALQQRHNLNCPA